MSHERADLLEMTYLVRHENELVEQVDGAREDVLLWARRGKLALEQNRLSLARQARDRAGQAKLEYSSLSRQLDEVRAQRRSLKRNARRRDLVHGEQSNFQAEMLVEQFRLRGLNPEEEELNQLAAQMDGELMTADLKAELGLGPKQRPLIPPAPSPSPRVQESARAEADTPPPAPRPARRPQPGPSSSAEAVSSQPTPSPQPIDKSDVDPLASLKRKMGGTSAGDSLSEEDQAALAAMLEELAE